MVAYEFFLDLLESVPLRHKKMFGVDAYYLEEKIVFAMNKDERWKEDIGIWISAPEIHQHELNNRLSNLRFLKRIPTKKWLLLPEDSDTFEEDAAAAAELIKKGSDWIGTVPKPKKKKAKK